MIKKAKDLKKETKKFLENLLKKYETSNGDYDMYDDEYFTITHFLKKDCYGNLYVVLKGNKIVDIISFEYTYGIKTLYPMFFGDKKYTLECIRKYFKKNVLIGTEWIDTEKFGFHFVKLESSFNSDYTYETGSSAYSVIDASEVYILRDAIEKARFPEMGEISFKVIDGKDVRDYLYDKKEESYPMWTKKFSCPGIIGFHYFENLFSEHHTLLVAETNGMPIGVIKYGLYETDSKYTHYGLNYIDVNMKYRQRGVAKMLIEKLAETIPTDYPLVLSAESDMGQQCRIAEHFKAKIENCFSYEDWNDYWCRKAYSA